MNAIHGFRHEHLCHTDSQMCQEQSEAAATRARSNARRPRPQWWPRYYCEVSNKNQFARIHLHSPICNTLTHYTHTHCIYFFLVRSNIARIRCECAVRRPTNLCGILYTFYKDTSTVSNCKATDKITGSPEFIQSEQQS